MLDETLVIRTGEFGRTVYTQGKPDMSKYRDHHPRCFSMWMAGGGIKPGMTYGTTAASIARIICSATDRSSKPIQITKIAR